MIKLVRYIIPLEAALLDVARHLWSPFHRGVKRARRGAYYTPRARHPARHLSP